MEVAGPLGTPLGLAQRPLAVFGLSLIGWPVLVGVASPIVLVILLVVVLKILQSFCPGSLPQKLRSWDFLPFWMRSLEPWDKLITSLTSCFQRRCCCCCRVCCRVCCGLCGCSKCCRCSKCCEDLEEVKDEPVKSPEAFNNLAMDKEAQDGVTKSEVDASGTKIVSSVIARESWGWRSSHCRAEETSPKRVSGT